MEKLSLPGSLGSISPKKHVPGIHNDDTQPGTSSSSSSATDMELTAAVAAAAAAGLSDKPTSPTPQMRLSDVLKQKKPPKRGSSRKNSSSSCHHSGNLDDSVEMFSCSSTSNKAGGTGTPGRVTPTKSGKAAGSAAAAAAIASNKEEIKQWIRDEAQKFCKKYSCGVENQGIGNNKTRSSHPAHTTLNSLSDATQMLSATSQLKMSGNSEDLRALREIAAIICDSDVSPFEIIHSGWLASCWHTSRNSQRPEITG